MSPTDRIIRTKLRQPFIRADLVSRPRLQERFIEGLHLPLTLVIAPAGFGKTTLVTGSLADCKTPVAWLSLDRDDNLPGRFLLYLIAALQTSTLPVGKEADQLLSQQAQPEAILTSLINDLDVAGQELILVLDDYHFINSQEVHNAVVFLLEHCPGSLHMVIATRSDPPLPLVRLRARGQMLELRVADLSFTENEAALFLNRVMGLDLDADAINTLEQRTEGWVAGLQMAALSMRDRQDINVFIQGFSGTHRYILDYLLEEVLSNQPAEIRSFLLRTSILERLSAPLCDALPLDESSSILTPSASILEYLERQNLFLISLDDDFVWFRYHHLFADLLKAQLQQHHPDLVQNLHRQAAAWLEQQGLVGTAIQHLLTIQEYQHAARLFEEYGPDLWVKGDLSVMQMVNNLPHDLLLSHPKIGLYQSWLLVNQGNIEQALPLINDLKHAINPLTHPECNWMQTFILLVLAFLMPPELTRLPDDGVLDEIPISEIILRDAADILYGMALGRRNELERAVEFSLKCIRKKRQNSTLSSYELTSVLSLVPFLATIYWFQGRLFAAAAICREYLEIIKNRELSVSAAGNLAIVLGAVLYDWNSLDEAEKYIREGLLVNEAWKNIMTDAFGLLALVHLLNARADYAAALQTVDKFENRLQDLSRPVEFSEDYRTLRIQVLLSAGELDSAAQWAEQVINAEDYQRYPQYYRVTLARIRLAQGRYVDVENYLSGVSTQDLAGNRLIRRIESDLLLAAAYAGQQRFADAFFLLETCLNLTEPEAYIRIYLEQGQPLRDLLSAYLRSPAPVHKVYVQKLLVAFPPNAPVEAGLPQQDALIEPLSARELEVLALMAMGRTNIEISRQLIVAPGTIKAHAASIYRKLDAANRTEAVARARALGFLD
ncbi:MAG: LuxR C-terminal-related transcriptional regulator [Anaerolineae bacterium]|nr:LuxR C-terminal-related transcriptional regulator [Anaerolineae bacterium]